MTTHLPPWNMLPQRGSPACEKTKLCTLLSDFKRHKISEQAAWDALAAAIKRVVKTVNPSFGKSLSNAWFEYALVRHDFLGIERPKELTLLCHAARSIEIKERQTKGRTSGTQSTKCSAHERKSLIKQEFQALRDNHPNVKKEWIQRQIADKHKSAFGFCLRTIQTATLGLK